jgi:hypothetical protein
MIKTWTISFGGSSAQIINNAAEVDAYIGLIFKDLIGVKANAFITIYEVKQDLEKFLVFKDGSHVFSYREGVEVANYLMNAIKHDLTKNIENKLAIHSALVSDSKGSVLLPGASGAGKSSLTAGLIKLGFHYHTDELVLIDFDQDELLPFVRPLNVKLKGLNPVLDLFGLDRANPELMIGTHASSIPHRLLNPNYICVPPSLRAIVFPKYLENDLPSVRKMSAAEAMIEIMRCNVLARNLPGLGVERIKTIVQKIPAYSFTYSHFDQVLSLLDDCNLYPNK